MTLGETLEPVFVDVNLALLLDILYVKSRYTCVYMYIFNVCTRIVIYVVVVTNYPLMTWF